MILDLGKTFPSINNKRIFVNNIDPDSFTKILNVFPRIIKMDMGVSIYVFDQIGIRFWERNNKVYEVELAFVKSNDYKCPKEVFIGEVFINKKQLSLPIFIEAIKNLENVEVIKDNDSHRFGLNVYHVRLGNRKYSFWTDDDDKEVVTIRITAP